MRSRRSRATITDENFDKAIPNPPKITTGKVVVHSDGLVAVR